MTFNQFFKKTFCIYLEKRASDWILPATGEKIPGCLPVATAEFSKHELQVEMIPGIDGMLLDFLETKSADGEGLVSKGDLGCTRSHLKVLNMAIEQKLENYFCFESDVVLHPDFNNLFDSFIKKLPDDWDMIYLGANHDSGFKYISSHSAWWYDNVSKLYPGSITHPFVGNIVRMIRSYTTHAIGIRHTLYDALQKVWNNIEKVDVGIASLHKDFNCYCFRPHLAWQRVGYSDILQRLTNYDHLRNEQRYVYNAEKDLWVIKTDDK